MDILFSESATGPSAAIEFPGRKCDAADVLTKSAALEQSKAEIQGEILEGLSRGRYAGDT